MSTPTGTVTAPAPANMKQEQQEQIQQDKQQTKQTIERKARKQVTGEQPKRTTIPEGSTYNLWYHKWGGGDRYNREIVAAPSRCHPEFDTGRTKAPPNTRTFCLHFAHGACNKGYECQFLHKIPTLDDPVETTIDAFGRDRFREQKGDMGGIGSFDRENRTLYVGKIQCDRDEIENIVARHFGEFGKIQRLRALPGKKVAFVTYVSRLNAEFAKEAMMEQALDNGEILNVRWATEDPAWYAKQATHKDAVDRMVISARQTLPPQLGGTNTEAAKQEEMTEEEATAAWMAYYQQFEEAQPQGILNSNTLQAINSNGSKRIEAKPVPTPIHASTAPAKTLKRPALAMLGGYTSDDD